MTGNEMRKLQAPRRAHAFLQANTPAARPPACAAQLAVLDGVLARLSTLAVDQDAGRRSTEGETRRIEALRHALEHEHLRPIGRLARTLLADVPGVERTLRMPRPRTHPERLLAAAGAMAELAEAHAQRFTDAGLPAAFLTELRAAAEALRASIGTRATSRQRGVGATAAVKPELAAGMRAVAQLDAMVTLLFKRDPQLVAEWRAASRVEVKRGGTASSSASVVSAATASAPVLTLEPAGAVGPAVVAGEGVVGRAA